MNTATLSPEIARRPALLYGVILVGYAAFFCVFFSPVLFGHRFLTWGDGLTLAIPAFLGKHALWEPNIMLGYPWASNLNGFWYPLRLLGLLPHSFNAYMLSAYVFAAFGTFGLVLSLTRSVTAGIASGLIYSLSGFMLSHSGHYDIVHPAAWTPFLMWSLAEWSARAQLRWIAIGALSIGCCATGGQPQVLAYTLFLAVFYVLSLSKAVEQRRRFFLGAIGIIVLGLGLSAVAFIPAADLARQSIRASLLLTDFLKYSVPPVELPVRMLFPYFLGVTQMFPYRFSSIDFDTFTELSNYVGIGSFALISVAITRFRASGQVRFWLIIACVALVLSTGDGLGFGHLVYQIPILNLFRAQGRHALEFTLAASVLTGFGIAAIEQGTARYRIILTCIAVVALAITAILLAIFRFDGTFAQEVARASKLELFPIDPFHNPALGVPIVMFGVVALIIALWSRRPAALPLRALLLAGIVIDLGSFAWFAPWHWASPAASDLEPPAYIGQLRSELDRTHQRVLSYSGSQPPMVVPPDVSLLWGVPAAGGYVQLELARTASFLEMLPNGVVNPELYARDDDQALDLSAVRYVAMRGEPELPLSAPWDSTELNQRVGAPAWAAQKALRLTLHKPADATRLLLVSSMGDSVEISQNTRVADLIVTTERGTSATYQIIAGRDTAEIAYDRPDVKRAVRHDRATVFSTIAEVNHTYLMSVALRHRISVKSIAVKWRYRDPQHGVLTIARISLIDDNKGRAHPVTSAAAFEADKTRWRRVERNTDPDLLFENLAVRPRAWVVHHLIRVTRDAALAAIRSGIYDTRKIALVEGPISLDSDSRAPSESAEITETAPTRMTLNVTCNTACFLITSDTYYRGWNASVDGSPTPLERVDYALRGVIVPQGKHTVRFEYRPKIVALSGAIAGLALCFSVALLVLPIWPRRSVRESIQGDL